MSNIGQGTKVLRIASCSYDQHSAGQSYFSFSSGADNNQKLEDSEVRVRLQPIFTAAGQTPFVAYQSLGIACWINLDSN